MSKPKKIIAACVVPLLFFAFTYCVANPIDEEYAGTLVQTTLAVSEPIVVEKLIGGLSGAQLYVVSAGGKKYVVRFFDREKPDKWEREIANLKVASQGGYGQLSLFAEASQGVVIMEFLPAKQISSEQRQTEHLYVELARVLQKLHCGSHFQGSLDVFYRVHKELAKVEAVAKSGIPLDKIQRMLREIQRACALRAETAPCHNDLNPGNLIFLGQEFKIIDFETAAQADPYFDLSTVAIFYCMMNPVCERVLVTAYLNREPTPQEEARFYLMKQLVRINYALGFLWMAGP